MNHIEGQLHKKTKNKTNFIKVMKFFNDIDA